MERQILYLTDLTDKGLIRKRIFRENLSFLFKINQSIQSYRKTKNCYITFVERFDGAGAQIHSILSIMLFAKKFNLQYLHTPLNAVAHFKGDRKGWSDKWETFFSLGYNEMQLNRIVSSDIQQGSIKFPGLLYKTANTIYKVSNCHSYTDLFANDYITLLEDFKTKYYLTLKEDLFENKEILNIAVHIRRGDVDDIQKRFNRYTSNEVLLERIELIITILRQNNISFKLNIFSQGQVSDFSDFFKHDANLFLNEDAFKTFHSLVKADVLVMAKSSFSYLAALLNEGIVIYEPFWHKPLNKWLRTGFTSSELQAAFSARNSTLKYHIASRN